MFVEDKEFLSLVSVPPAVASPPAYGCSLDWRRSARARSPSAIASSTMPPKDRNIAMVFQSYALYPHHAVYDNMAFGLKLRETPKAEIDRRVKEAGASWASRTCSTASPSSSPVASDSGGLGTGHRPRAGRIPHGRAALQPRCQAAGPDPRRDLQAAPAPGTTFIYVTHDQTEAMTMGSRICVSGTGSVPMQLNSPQKLYDHPDNVFVAGFIGSPAMNFFDVTVVEPGRQSVGGRWTSGSSCPR